MKIVHTTTIFAVCDLERSLRFYTGMLGFSIEFRFDYYAGVKLDNCRIGLSGRD